MDTPRSSRSARVISMVVLGVALVFVGFSPVGAQEPTTTTTTTATTTTTTTTTVPPTTVPPTTVPPVTVPPTTVPPAPTTPVPDMMGLPADSGSGRRVVYSVGQQRVWWVESDGLPVHTYLVSGKANTPKPGTYHVFSKSLNTTSVNGAARMTHMVRFAHGRGAAIGFHSIPVNRAGKPLQSEAELGQYRSAGCVRQSNGNAAFLYAWAPIGTAVVVVK